MAALAAQGDRIFWSHVKPLASVCGALFALGLFGSILGSIATLLVYNVPNIYVRMTGFSKGWNGGLDVVQGLKSPGADRAFMRVRETTSVALGVVAGLAVLGAATSTNVMDRSVPGTTVGAALTILAVLGWVLLRKDVAITPVIYILGVAAVAVFLLLDTGLTL
jgi:mannose/fructose/N-acetylgalactosamine-specific phosphotransferase system component IID